MSRTFYRAGFAALALLAFHAGGAAAQSVLATRGLGYPIEPLEARARGMGGVALGLPEPSFSLVNPAGAVGILAAAVSVTFQPDLFEATAGAEATEGSTARFPSVQAAFPTRGRFTVSVGYGSFLDQNYRVTRSDSVTLSTGRVPVEDRFRSQGGVARFRGGVGYQVNPRLAVGAALDVFTGAVRDTSTRFVGGLIPAQSASTVTYTGLGGAVGVRWTPLAALTVAGAVSGGGELTGDVDDETVADRTYSLPLTVDAGASARVTGHTVLAVSGRWAGWSAADDDILSRGGARDAMNASAGLEYDGLSILGQPFPLRLGARMARLPFRFLGTDAEFPDERAVSAGIGARLGRGAALFDAAIERGTRGGDAAGFDEPFWRGSVSVTVFAR
ncbi:MAG TPA: hypothetical protein VF613_12475 [Longimicrobium sp.]|jgi:hypothetical protein